MVNFVCRYGYGTREYNQNLLHTAALTYLPDIYTDNSYLNKCKGIYQVKPVAVFLMTCYNTCFMFQIDKADNLMIETGDDFSLFFFSLIHGPNGKKPLRYIPNAIIKP